MISAVTATPGSQGVLITWKTDEIASSQIEYGVADLFDQATAETDTSPRVTSHSVAITGLTSCSTYRFRIVSIDQLDNKAVRAPLSFTTTACSGNAAVTTQSTKLVSDAGGQASLNVGTAALQLQVPSGSVSKETDFQIKQLSPAPALGGIGQPAGRHLVGSHIYDLKALQEDNVVVTDFNGGLTVSITYSAAEAAGFTPSSFAIFRHNGTSWQQLDNCQANTVARVVSCQTSHFSVFGLFGERYVAPDPVPEGEGTVEPDPVPEIAPTKPQPEEEQTGQIEAASENRGLSATVTRAFKTIINRPVWWVSLLLLAISVVTLLVLKRRRGRSNTKKHVPYGIHKDD